MSHLWELSLTFKKNLCPEEAALVGLLGFIVVLCVVRFLIGASSEGTASSLWARSAVE